MANGGDDKSIPWQVRAVVTIGVPAALCIYFAYAITNSYITDIKNISHILIEHNSVTGGVIKTIDAERKGQQETNELVIRILMANCINGASTYEERTRCIE